MNRSEWIALKDQKLGTKDGVKKAIDQYYKEFTDDNLDHLFKIINLPWSDTFLHRLLEFVDGHINNLALDDCELFKIYHMLNDPKYSKVNISNEVMLFIMWCVCDDSKDDRAWHHYYHNPSGLNDFE